MTPDDRQVYSGLLHLKEMEYVLTDLLTYVNKQITMDAIQVAPGSSVPSELTGKVVFCHIQMIGEIESECAFTHSICNSSLPCFGNRH